MVLGVQHGWHDVLCSRPPQTPTIYPWLGDNGAGWLQVEAVENHMPEIVIVDEIGTEAEALACRTIAERGVQLIATAHGQLLENLLKNPTLSDLVGGIQSVTLGARRLLHGPPLFAPSTPLQPTPPHCLAVICRFVLFSSRCTTYFPFLDQWAVRLGAHLQCLLVHPWCMLVMHPTKHTRPHQAWRLESPVPQDLVECSGDEEARARGTQKSVLERKAPPTFPLVIEMRERAYWVTHWVEDSVDCLLHGKVPVVQVLPPPLVWSGGGLSA